MAKFECYGTWRVTTEGDVEGRSTKQLGVYTGFIDDIAFYLSKQSYYTLSFYKTGGEIKKEDIKDSNSEVSISVSGYDRYDVIKTIQNELGDTIKCEVGNYYESIKLSLNDDEKHKLLRRTGLSKLSDEEKVALGLK